MTTLESVEIVETGRWPQAGDAWSAIIGGAVAAAAISLILLVLGAGLGVTITAEGVETEAEFRYLRAEGCHEGQGFLFSRPRPNAEIARLLAMQAGYGAGPDMCLAAG